MNCVYAPYNNEDVNAEERDKEAEWVKELEEVYNNGKVDGAEELANEIIMHLADWMLAESPEIWDENYKRKQLICNTINGCIELVNEHLEKRFGGGK